MRTIRAIVLSLVAVSCMVGGAAADQIFFGHADGIIEARDEFNLTADIILPGTGANNINFGGPSPTPEEGITALAAGTDGSGNDVLIIGTGMGNGHVRPLSNMNDDIGSLPGAGFTGNASEPITDFAVRSDAGVYLTTAFNCCGPPLSGGAIFGRTTVSNLGSVIAGLSGDGGAPTSTGGPLLSVAVLSNDDAVIGSKDGELNVLSSTNLGAEVTTGQVLFGPRMNDITILSDDTIVVGLENGDVSVRSVPDLTVDMGTVNFGSAVLSLATLANDLVAIGLASGEVHVQDPSNIATDLGNMAQFNLKPILALAATSNGNLVIADGDGGGGSQVYVRTAADVTAIPAGALGDGSVLLTGSDIQALALFPSAGGPALLLGDGNNDGSVTADDLISVQQNFGNVGPNGDGTDFGDTNDDGTVTADDLITVQQNFGNTLGPAGAAPVPEPAAIALVCCLGGLIGLGRRR